MSEGWIFTDGLVYVRECRIAKIVIAVEYDNPFALCPADDLVAGGIRPSVLGKFHEHDMRMLLGIIFYDGSC